LELLNSGSYLADVYQYIQPENNEWILTAACILFVTATFGRNQIKYGERGYRGVLFDAGHLAQNLQLSAEYLRHGACLSMACLDDEMNDFLRIDGIEESILYSVIIGTLE
jgi:SagB-type dehydrogenase family enzyme